MNNIDRQYKELLEQIMNFGTKKADRTGTGTMSIFGWQIRHKMSEGFPLLTTKKMAFKTMVTELLWFLRGDTNIKWLLEHDCHIWDGDAYKNYCKHMSGNLVEYEYWMFQNADRSFRMYTKEEFTMLIRDDPEFTHMWGELGPIYGKQWRKWTDHINSDKVLANCPEYIDQIAELIDQIKKNPDSRRLMVSAWNVAEIEQAILPPCHYGFQIYTRELSLKERYRLWFDTNYETGMEYDETKEVNFEDEYWATTPRRAISLMWNQRSVDTPLGLPMNIASYGLLLLLIAKEVDMYPEELIGNLGDCHVYLNQIDGVKEQLKNSPFDLPYIKMADKDIKDLAEYNIEDIKLENYVSHAKISFPLSN